MMFVPIPGYGADIVSVVPSNRMIVAVITVTYDWPDPPAKMTETQGSVATVFFVTWMATCWNGGTTSVGFGSRSAVGRGTTVGVGVRVGVIAGVAGGVTTGLLHPAARISPVHRRRKGSNAFIMELSPTIIKWFPHSLPRVLFDWKLTRAGARFPLKSFFPIGHFS
jgi:hypothetical protein